MKMMSVQKYLINLRTIKHVDLVDQICPILVVTHDKDKAKIFVLSFPTLTHPRN